MVITILAVFISCLAGCVSGSEVRAVSSGNGSISPLKRLTMGMTPPEVRRFLPDTPCKVDTLYHGNPAQAWGYRTEVSTDKFLVTQSICQSADYWIYFENERLVGWTPVADGVR